MKQSIFQITENIPLTENVYRMRLIGDLSEIKSPGQFVNIRLSGYFLRRPISVCDCEGNTLTLIYKIVGKGTYAMKNMLPGEELDILSGLGNGYDTAPAGNTPLLIGGGVGVPPLYLLAKKLLAEKKDVSVILGFNTSSEVFYEKEFADLGAKVFVTTADGSYGTKGFVTTLLPKMQPSYIYTCGPEPMLQAVYAASSCSGQYSFEARMGCGFGACMGCSCQTISGAKRICKEGPVLKKEEILWQK